MKKLFAGMVVSIMLIGLMGTTVFAANSPNSKEIEASVLNSKVTSIDAKDANGYRITVTKKDVDTVIMDWGQSEAAKLGTGAQVFAMSDLSVSGSSKGAVTVTLNVEKIRSGDNIHVYHYNSTTRTWEDLNTVSGSNVKVAEGSVTVTMSSFSPVMVVYVPATDASQKDDTQNSTQDSTQNSTESGTQNDQNTGSSSAEDYTQGYNDGYEAGVNSVSNISSGASSGSSKNGKTSKSKSSSSGKSSKTVSKTVTRTIYKTGNTTTSPVNTSATSPKTGASLPALPFVAMFAFAGLLVCNKKGQNQ
jgi:hypothetical protein